ncbi:hypothetical protein XCR1_180005 [Xenorhabdus cabanillasii JM26]|uniref:Uncharacterized protein n=1 Tax=Xenorhabdus cabanillasii JM26 TaxID=1427517 RepID=W1J0Z6_9GAMM|nr:hypothetical protein XCR1_180005 [Xenorhabdus cabanillasii JM26]
MYFYAILYHSINMLCELHFVTPCTAKSTKVIWHYKYLFELKGLVLNIIYLIAEAVK